MIALQVIFWISVFLILYTYLLFPAILHLLARGKTISAIPLDNNALPKISILIAAYNEEEVLEAKIESILASDYPSDRLEILVGSDASTDGTNVILQKLEEKNPGLRISLFEERTGKPGLINHLVEETSGDLLVITDANVMLHPSALSEMIRLFGDPKVGLVDSQMINTKMKKEGISRQEKFYISREVRIKHNESVIWGSMMGPFGGCYAVRKSLYRPVPKNFLVDDFFINMAVLEQGYSCISNKDAMVFEDASNDQQEEFRRKSRISAGNFQNLIEYKSLLLSRAPGIAFCYLSHKVIRWFVPVLVIITLLSATYVGSYMLLYRIFALLQILVLLVPIIDYFLRNIRIHSLPLRFISHFVLMNLALLAGLLRFMGGIRSNVWEPTRRNQD